MATVYLGLGSNLGNRRENIERALKLLEEHHVTLEKMSTIIETEPVDGPPQGKFLNAVLKITTDLSAQDLLMHTQMIEKDMGRVKTLKDGPRIIDIDILLYDQLKIQTPTLTIPHPRMLSRDFVLIPLQEIDPDWARELIR